MESKCKNVNRNLLEDVNSQGQSILSLLGFALPTLQGTGAIQHISQMWNKLLDLQPIERKKALRATVPNKASPRSAAERNSGTLSNNHMILVPLK